MSVFFRKLNWKKKLPMTYFIYVWARYAPLTVNKKTLSMNFTWFAFPVVTTILNLVFIIVAFVPKILPYWCLPLNNMLLHLDVIEVYINDARFYVICFSASCYVFENHLCCYIYRYFINFHSCMYLQLK